MQDSIHDIEVLRRELQQQAAGADSNIDREIFEQAVTALEEPAPLEEPPAILDKVSLAKMIDHTALQPDATHSVIGRLCLEAREGGFAAVCVNAGFVPFASEQLQKSGVAVCAVVDFPLGGSLTLAKISEARAAIQEGATEIDMVLNAGRLKSGFFQDVEEDIHGVVEAAKKEIDGEVIVKVTLETSLLTNIEKVLACVLSARAGADFVKTSTGFSSGGATPEDVALMRQVVGDQMGVKASGGIRTREMAVDMIAHGASRIGSSSSVDIMDANFAKA